MDWLVLSQNIYDPAERNCTSNKNTKILPNTSHSSSSSWIIVILYRWPNSLKLISLKIPSRFILWTFFIFLFYIFINFDAITPNGVSKIKYLIDSEINSCKIDLTRRGLESSLVKSSRSCRCRYPGRLEARHKGARTSRHGRRAKHNAGWARAAQRNYYTGL